MSVRQHMKVVRPELNVTSFPVRDFASPSASQTIVLVTTSLPRTLRRRCTRIEPSSTRNGFPSSIGLKQPPKQRQGLLTHMFKKKEPAAAAVEPEMIDLS